MKTQLPAGRHPLLHLALDPDRAAHGRGVALSLGLVILIAIADYATGYEFSLVVLYLVPILLATWISGRNAGIVTACFAVLLWTAMFAPQHPFLHAFYVVWEALLQFAVYVAFALVLDRLKAAIAHADERFATVLEGLDVAVYVSDEASGELLYANAPFRRTFGTGTPPALPVGHRQAEVHDEGLNRWFLVEMRSMRWIDGRPARLYMATDITERRRAEELYLQQQEKLALTARLVAVGEMATTLAHELNQPLAAIANYNAGCARRLRSGDWKPEEIIEAVEKGAAQAERASSVVQRLREFVARRTPKLIACDINEVARGVLPAIEGEAAKHAIRLELALSHHVPYARADQTLMEQVILNLARNAIEAMQDVPVADRELRISSRNGLGGTIEVDVADHGHGIAAELEGNLFSPFFSTKPDGMGLGLHISRSIVEAHGGHLWMTRNVPRGTVFHFSLQSVYSE